MAQKDKSGVWGSVLNFFGLKEEEQPAEYNREYNARNARASSARNPYPEEEDPFSEPPLQRPAPRREAQRAYTATGRNAPARGNRPASLEDRPSWENAARTEYDAERSAQRADSHRPNPTRYGSGQRFGTGSQTPRPADYYAPGEGGAYRRGASSYGATQRRSVPSYTQRGTSGRWNEETSTVGAAYGAAEEQASRPAGSGYQRHQTVIFQLQSVDECKDVILALIDRKSVLLNLDRLDMDLAQRAVDTMCGATFAIGATLSRASDRTWLITPSNVDVASAQVDPNDYARRGRNG